MFLKDERGCLACILASSELSTGDGDPLEAAAESVVRNLVDDCDGEAYPASDLHIQTVLEGSVDFGLASGCDERAKSLIDSTAIATDEAARIVRAAPRDAKIRRRIPDSLPMAGLAQRLDRLA